jgi:hypothetical protein
MNAGLISVAPEHRTPAGTMSLAMAQMHARMVRAI